MDKQFSDAYDHIQKILNENAEPGPPTEEEFNKYIAAFNKDNYYVNYIFRNFSVGDEEEFQTEQNGQLSPDVAENLRKVLNVKSSYAEEVIAALDTYYATGRNGDRVLQLVKPYIDNPELAETNFAAWADIFFMAVEDDTDYGSFLGEYEN